MIKQALILLGYNQDWLDLEIITEKIVLDQYRKILHSQDNNAEYYRHKAFNNYLDSQEKLTDESIEKILQLIDTGSGHYDLHCSRVISLIYSGLISDEQFNKLSQYRAILEDPIQKFYKRTKIIRNIKKNGLTANFDQVIASKDITVQTFAVNNKQISHTQLKWFANYGYNKIIRKHAQHLLFEFYE